MTRESPDFEQILRETHLKIRAFIRGAGVPRADVDDVAQEVYIQFHRGMEKRPDNVAPIRWLKGIARNLCVNYFRQKERRAKKHREAISEILIGTRSAWEKEQPQDEVFSALRHCLEKMSPKNRQLLLLKYEKELVSEKIGEMRGMSSGAVRKLLHRLRVALKQCIEGELNDKSGEHCFTD